MKPRRVRIGSSVALGSPEQDEAGVNSDRSSGWRLRQTFSGFLLVGALAYLGAAVALHRLVDAQDLARWLEPRVGAALNRRVTLESASLSVFPLPALDAHDVRVDNLPGFDGPPLAQVERVRLKVALLPLLTGTVRVRRVDLRRPVLHLAVDSSGESNYGDLVPASHDVAPESPEPPFAVEVQSVTMSGGRVTVVHEPRRESLLLSGLVGETRLRRDEGGAWDLTVTARTDSLILHTRVLGERAYRAAGPSVRIAAVSDSAVERIRVEEGEVTVAGATVVVTGQIDSLRSTSRWVDAHVSGDSIPAGDVVAALPETLRRRLPAEAQGSISLDLTVQGIIDPRHGPRIAGKVTLDGVGLTRGEAALVRGLSGELMLGDGAADVASLHGTFLGGPLSIEGSRSGEDPKLALHVEMHPSLGDLQGLEMMPAGFELTGDADADVTFSGGVDAGGEARLDGRVAVVGVRAQHPKLGESVYVPRAELRLQATQGRWTGVTVLLGEDPVSTSGTVQGLLSWMTGAAESLPEVHAEVRAPRLRLDRILPLQDGARRRTYAQLAFAHAGGRQLDGAVPAELAGARGLSRPGALPVRGQVEVQLDTLEYGSYHLERVRARAELARDSLSLTSVELIAWGGRVTGALMLGLGHDIEEPFRLRLATEGVEGPALLSSLTTLGPAVQGDMYLDLELSGTTDTLLLPSAASLAGRGRLAVREGRLGPNRLTGSVADFLERDEWEELAFSALITPFEVRDQAFHLRDSRIESSLGRLRGSGSIALGGQVDLALSVTIPAGELDMVSLRRTGISASVVSRLQQAGSPIELGLHLGGSVARPVLEPDGRIASTDLTSRSEPGPTRAGGATPSQQPPRSPAPR